MLDNATAASIGPLLRRVRLNDDRALADIAQMIGASEHSIARYEHGAEFTVSVFLRWCAALKVAPAEVIRAATTLGSASSGDLAEPQPVATRED